MILYLYGFKGEKIIYFILQVLTIFYNNYYFKKLFVNILFTVILCNIMLCFIMYKINK
jgi:hypothetical protein